MNKVVLIGRLTKDPELKFTPNDGKAVASITLAVDRNRKNSEGQREADFINIVIWGKNGENTANYMTKGKLMGVSGRLQVRSYTAKDGSKRYTTEVVADEVQFLEYKNNNNTAASSNSYDGQYFEDEMTPIEDGEIPF